MKVKVIAISSIVFVIITIVGGVIAMKHKRDDVCKNVVIKITDDYKLGLITVRGIENCLKKNELYPLDKSFSKINCEEIEDVLRNEDMMIGEVECYKMTGGEVVINIWQRNPIMEVKTKQAHYFVDENRKIIPYRSSNNVDFIHVSGRMSEDFVLTEVFDLVHWLQEDKYWRDKVSMITIVNENYVEMQLKKITPIVILGEVEDYDTRMHKMQVLLSKNEAENINQFREIDLRFGGQVICRK